MGRVADDICRLVTYVRGRHPSCGRRPGVGKASAVQLVGLYAASQVQAATVEVYWARFGGWIQMRVGGAAGVILARQRARS
jgi:hypothetical protein